MPSSESDQEFPQPSKPSTIRHTSDNYLTSSELRQLIEAKRHEYLLKHYQYVERVYQLKQAYRQAVLRLLQAEEHLQTLEREAEIIKVKQAGLEAKLKAYQTRLELEKQNQQALLKSLMVNSARTLFSQVMVFGKGDLHSTAEQNYPVLLRQLRDKATRQYRQFFGIEGPFLATVLNDVRLTIALCRRNSSKPNAVHYYISQLYAIEAEQEVSIADNKAMMDKEIIVSKQDDTSRLQSIRGCDSKAQTRLDNFIKRIENQKARIDQLKQGQLNLWQAFSQSVTVKQNQITEVKQRISDLTKEMLKINAQLATLAQQTQQLKNAKQQAEKSNSQRNQQVGQARQAYREAIINRQITVVVETEGKNDQVVKDKLQQSATYLAERLFKQGILEIYGSVDEDLENIISFENLERLAPKKIGWTRQGEYFQIVAAFPFELRVAPNQVPIYEYYQKKGTIITCPSQANGVIYKVLMDAKEWWHLGSGEDEIGYTYKEMQSYLTQKGGH